MQVYLIFLMTFVLNKIYVLRKNKYTKSIFDICKLKKLTLILIQFNFSDNYNINS